MVVDLEAALRDSPLENFRSTVDEFFRRCPVEMLQLRPADFVQTIVNAMASLASESVSMAGSGPS